MRLDRGLNWRLDVRLGPIGGRKSVLFQRFRFVNQRLWNGRRGFRYRSGFFNGRGQNRGWDNFGLRGFNWRRHRRVAEYRFKGGGNRVMDGLGVGYRRGFRVGNVGHIAE
jgi:hypothetical protein